MSCLAGPGILNNPAKMNCQFFFFATLPNCGDATADQLRTHPTCISQFFTWCRYTWARFCTQPVLTCPCRVASRVLCVDMRSLWRPGKLGIAAGSSSEAATSLVEQDVQRQWIPSRISSLTSRRSKGRDAVPHLVRSTPYSTLVRSEDIPNTQ